MATHTGNVERTLLTFTACDLVTAPVESSEVDTLSSSSSTSVLTTMSISFSSGAPDASKAATLTLSEAEDWSLPDDPELLEVEVVRLLLPCLPELFFLVRAPFLVALAAFFLVSGLLWEEEAPACEEGCEVLFSAPADGPAICLEGEAILFGFGEFFAVEFPTVELEEDFATGFLSFWGRAALLLVPSEDDESSEKDEDDVASPSLFLDFALTGTAAFLFVGRAIFFRALAVAWTQREGGSPAPVLEAFFLPAATRLTVSWSEEEDPGLFRERAPL